MRTSSTSDRLRQARRYAARFIEGDRQGPDGNRSSVKWHVARSSRIPPPYAVALVPEPIVRAPHRAGSCCEPAAATPVGKCGDLAASDWPPTSQKGASPFAVLGHHIGNSSLTPRRYAPHLVHATVGVRPAAESLAGDRTPGIAWTREHLDPDTKVLGNAEDSLRHRPGDRRARYRQDRRDVTSAFGDHRRRASGRYSRCY